MRPDIQLHIFSNATWTAPDTQLIKKTHASFCDTFGHDLETTVWCDPHPNLDQATQYLNNLRGIWDQVIETQSLSDGYVRAVNSSSRPFLFMLEHDWVFLPSIMHSLTEIIRAMIQQDILHLRFNKRANVAKKSDRALQQIDCEIMPYCTTGFLSNNPHIIARDRYIAQALPLITVREKTFGIEKDLSQGQLKGAIYGPQGHPATIMHLDGKSFCPT